MVYYCKFLMMGFTPAEAWQLWKYKLSLFNTKTYNVLKYCWLKFVILREKLRQKYHDDLCEECDYGSIGGRK